jgi:hypothetical protein
VKLAEARRNPPCVEFAWRVGYLCCTQGTATARAPPVGAFLAIVPLTCSSSAPRGIRTPNIQIRSLVLCVDLVGSRRIWPAHVGGLVDPDGSRRNPSDRLDDQPDDQASQAASDPGPTEHELSSVASSGPGQLTFRRRRERGGGWLGRAPTWRRKLRSQRTAQCSTPLPSWKRKAAPLPRRGTPRWVGVSHVASPGSAVALWPAARAR